MPAATGPRDPAEDAPALLEEWIVEALNRRRGTGTIVEVCEHVWNTHEADLRRLGSAFYTWQYDIRWAAHRLRTREVLRPSSLSPSGVWELAFRTMK